jgi:hypothetical protein
LFAQQNDLAKMVAGVISSKKDFAQQILAITPGNLRVEIRLRVFQQLLESGEISLQSFDRLLPLRG